MVHDRRQGCRRKRNRTRLLGGRLHRGTGAAREPAEDRALPRVRHTGFSQCATARGLWFREPFALPFHRAPADRFNGTNQIFDCSRNILTLENRDAKWGKNDVLRTDKRTLMQSRSDIAAPACIFHFHGECAAAKTSNRTGARPGHRDKLNPPPVKRGSCGGSTWICRFEPSYSLRSTRSRFCCS